MLMHCGRDIQAAAAAETGIVGQRGRASGAGVCRCRFARTYHRERTAAAASAESDALGKAGMAGCTCDNAGHEARNPRAAGTASLRRRRLASLSVNGAHLGLDDLLVCAFADLDDAFVVPFTGL